MLENTTSGHFGNDLCFNESEENILRLNPGDSMAASLARRYRQFFSTVIRKFNRIRRRRPRFSQASSRYIKVTRK